ncbi:MAG TPA: ice-binding family protein [Candidatus Paceibacterota bacterium]|nr:ice-binding family protein [Candidatus Paceibacterota bacterium]
MNIKTQIAKEAKEKMRKARFAYAAIISMVATTLMVIATPVASAATAISLGQANNFAVLAGGGISNTGATTIQGDLGIYPTVTYSDSGTLSLSGSYHFGDATAIAAKTDLATAYSLAVVAAPASVFTADLGGQTLVPGIYTNPTGLGVTGTLTLDAQGNPNAVFILQTPMSLNTAASSQVNIVNGGQACNVFWQVGTTTTLGANSDFKGTILTNSNFTGGANAKVLGRILSLGGSVALNANSIIKSPCTANKVETRVQITSPSSGSVQPGATLTLSAVASPKSGTGVCAGPISFSLNKNPLTGVVGSYPLTSPVVTTNWINGEYHLLATYPGDGYCLASTSNPVELVVGTQEKVQSRVVVSGAGSYISPFGRASFNLLIKSALPTFDTSTAVAGKVTWTVPRQWRFQGALNTYSSVNGAGTATGSGVLYAWNRTGHSGKWQAVTTGATNVTVKFTVPANSNSKKSRPITSFAIGFTGTIVAGVPALPVLGSLVTINRGHNSGRD